jgi:Domain of unknown function (DUF6471)
MHVMGFPGFAGVSPSYGSERLEVIGVKDTERNSSNKIARGGFTAVFFLHCMAAIGVQNIHLNGD